MKTTALCLALSSLIGLAITPAVRADDIRSDRAAPPLREARRFASYRPKDRTKATESRIS